MGISSSQLLLQTKQNNQTNQKMYRGAKIVAILAFCLVPLLMGRPQDAAAETTAAPAADAAAAPAADAAAPAANATAPADAAAAPAADASTEAAAAAETTAAPAAK